MTADVLLYASDFEPLVGQDLLVDAKPQPLHLRLESLSPSPPTGLGRSDPFCLVFSTPWNILLSEASYPLPIARGLAVVYIVPTQTAPGPRRFYHAVFN